MRNLFLGIILGAFAYLVQIILSFLEKYKESKARNEQSQIDVQRLENQLKESEHSRAETEDRASKLEEEVLLSLDIGDNCIISPGGSAVYSRKGMEFLKKNSRIIFLDAPFWLISRRIRDPADRGMVGLEGKTLKQLFNELFK